MQSGTHPGNPPADEPAFPSVAPVAGSIESTFSGENTGQIAVGSNIVQWTIHGDYVDASEEPARPRPRPRPVSVLPKKMHSFLDRDAERAAAVRAMESAMTVELCGAVGLGKTALLRHLAHNATGDYCHDGIVYLDDRDESLEDVLQYLYDTFFEYDIPYKPNEAELRLALADKCALVLVDEVALADEEVERLTNAVPRSTVVFAGTAPRVAGEVETVPLAGLPFAEALLLMQSALGRMVEAEELAAARALWEATEGNPGQILKAAKLARAEGVPIAPPVARSIGALDDVERRVLDVMRAFGRTPVAASHVAAIAAVPTAADVLAELDARELVELVDEKDRTYRLVSDVALLAVPAAELAPVRERAVEHFATTIAREGNADLEASGRTLDRRRDVAAVLVAAGWGLAGAAFARALPLAAWADGVLALAGRWGAARRLLERTLDGARRSGDRAAEAWSLHQTGSRSMAIGEKEAATPVLKEALRIREEIGDTDGAEVTRHNLGLLVPGKAPVDSRSMRTAFIIIGVAIVALIGLLLYMQRVYEVLGPVELVAARTPDDSTVVQVSWVDRADNEEGFSIERSTGGGPFREIGRAPAAHTFFADENVPAGVQLVYRARAYADDVFSRYSNLDTVGGVVVLSPTETPSGSPLLVVDTAAIDFGLVTVDSSAQRQLEITNAGTGSMMLVLTPPETPFAIADTITSMQLEPGARQVVTLRYDPTEDARQEGLLIIDTPDDTVPAIGIRLVGNGMGARTSAHFSMASFEPSTLASGARARLEVRFDGPVEGDQVVSLRSADRDVIVPGSVVVPAGRSRASVIVQMPRVSAERVVRVGATHETGSSVATVLVTPRGTQTTLAEIIIGERSVTGGAATKGSVRLSAPAPSGGAVVALGSRSSSVSVPSRVVVPEGATSAGFAIQTAPVRARQEVTIVAAYGGAQRSAPLTIVPRTQTPPDPPPTLFRLAIRPESNVIEVSRAGKSTATVGISRGMRGGVTVLLESSDPRIVVLPRSVTIPPGATSTEFSFNVRAPKNPTTVVITARVEQPISTSATAAVTVQQQQVILR